LPLTKRPRNNPLGLYPAYRLYENGAYGRLVEAFGLENVYILSAGWGLIGAAFLTPCYDITFSPSAEGYKRRRKTGPYRDFCMLPADESSEIVFLGGKDYVPLFCSVTAVVRNKRTVFTIRRFLPMHQERTASAQQFGVSHAERIRDANRELWKRRR
jgi:hypothetical protein